MTASYIGVGTVTGGAASGAVTSHASTLAGDVLILLTNAGGANVSTITGGSSPTWTKFGTTQTTSNSLVHLEVWYATAAAADIAASFTVTYTVSTQFTAALATWRGGSGATPSLGNFQGTIDNTAGTIITSPNWNGSVAVAYGAINSTGATPTCTVTGAAWTEIVDHARTTNIASDVANDTSTSGISNPGSTFTWTSSGASRAALTFNVIDAGGTPLFFGSN